MDATFNSPAGRNKSHARSNLSATIPDLCIAESSPHILFSIQSSSLTLCNQPTTPSPCFSSSTNTLLFKTPWSSDTGTMRIVPREWYEEQ